LIDAFNREESHEVILTSDDINVGATASVTTLWQPPDTWSIEKDDLQWTKTKKAKIV